MTVRVALVLLALGFLGLLVVMGAVSFVRWLRFAHPRHFRSILVSLCLALLGLGIWGFIEVLDRPSFHQDDLITLQEPMVAHMASADRTSPTIGCIVEIYEHLAVIDAGSGTIKARVESNKASGPSFCPVGAEVQFEQAWLHRYTLTHRHS